MAINLIRLSSYVFAIDNTVIQLNLLFCRPLIWVTNLIGNKQSARRWPRCNARNFQMISGYILAALSSTPLNDKYVLAQSLSDWIPICIYRPITGLAIRTYVEHVDEVVIESVRWPGLFLHTHLPVHRPSVRPFVGGRPRLFCSVSSWSTYRHFFLSCVLRAISTIRIPTYQWFDIKISIKWNRFLYSIKSCKNLRSPYLFIIASGVTKVSSQDHRLCFQLLIWHAVQTIN